MRIEWAPKALREVGDTVEYIARDRPGAATAWLDGLDAAVARLTAFPFSGRVLSVPTRAEVREIQYATHRVVYMVENDCVRILRVTHTRRLLDFEGL